MAVGESEEPHAHYIASLHAKNEAGLPNGIHSLPFLYDPHPPILDPVTVCDESGAPLTHQASGSTLRLCILKLIPPRSGVQDLNVVLTWTTDDDATVTEAHAVP